MAYFLIVVLVRPNTKKAKHNGTKFLLSQLISMCTDTLTGERTGRSVGATDVIPMIRLIAEAVRTNNPHVIYDNNNMCVDNFINHICRPSFLTCIVERYGYFTTYTVKFVGDVITILRRFRHNMVESPSESHLISPESCLDTLYQKIIDILSRIHFDNVRRQRKTRGITTVFEDDIDEGTSPIKEIPNMSQLFKSPEEHALKCSVTGRVIRTLFYVLLINSPHLISCVEPLKLTPHIMWLLSEDKKQTITTLLCIRSFERSLLNSFPNELMFMIFQFMWCPRLTR
jgi:hypothetical protein